MDAMTIIQRTLLTLLIASVLHGGADVANAAGVTRGGRRVVDGDGTKAGVSYSNCAAAAVVAVFLTPFVYAGVHRVHGVADAGVGEGHVWVVLVGRPREDRDFPPRPSQRRPRWQQQQQVLYTNEAQQLILLILLVLIGCSSSARDRVVYHYTRSLHGFAARLTEKEKNNLAGKLKKIRHIYFYI
jgi:hypothetical protein